MLRFHKVMHGELALENGVLCPLLVDRPFIKLPGIESLGEFVGFVALLVYLGMYLVHSF